MSAPQSKEEFEHFHQSAIKNLELDTAALKEIADKGAEEPLYDIDRELVSTLIKITGSLTSKDPAEPAVVFREALAGMDDIERKQFILRNLLEGLKNGDELKAIVERYKKLGLMPVVPDGGTPGAQKHDITNIGA